MNGNARFKQIALRLTQVQITIEEPVEFQLCWRAWDWRSGRPQKKFSQVFKQGALPETAVNWVFPSTAEVAPPEAFAGEVILLAMKEASAKKVAGRCAIDALVFLNAAQSVFKQRFPLQRCPDKLAHIELELRVSETNSPLNSFTHLSSLAAMSMDSGRLGDSRARSTAIGLTAAAIKAKSPGAARSEAKLPKTFSADKLHFSAMGGRQRQREASSSRSEPFEGKSSLAKLTAESEESPSKVALKHTMSLSKQAKKGVSRESIFSFKNSHPRSVDEWGAARDTQERLAEAESVVRDLRAEVERSREQLRQARMKEDAAIAFKAKMLDTEDEYNELEKENEELRRNVERLQRDNKVLLITRDEKTRIFEKKLKEIESLHADRDEFLRQNKALETELTIACKTVNGSQRERERLENELAITKKRMSTVMDVVTQASHSRELSKAELIHKLLSAINASN